MSKHTPGPWLPAEGISSVVGLPVVRSGPNGGRLICNVNHVHDPLHGKVAGDDKFNRESLANARLIAAAPEMFEALTELCNSIPSLSGGLAAHKLITAAQNGRAVLNKIVGLPEAE